MLSLLFNVKLENTKFKNLIWEIVTERFISSKRGSKNYLRPETCAPTP